MVSCRKGAEGETYTSRYVLCDEDDYRSNDNDSAYPNILNVTHIYVFRNDISNMYKNENDYFLCLLMCIYEIWYEYRKTMISIERFKSEVSKTYSRKYRFLHLYFDQMNNRGNKSQCDVFYIRSIPLFH